MDSEQGNGKDVEREVTATEDKRDQHQREQVEAQAAGNTGAEIVGAFKEMLDDHVQFPRDIAEDGKDPERRVDEEQGTTTQHGSEPAESR